MNDFFFDVFFPALALATPLLIAITVLSIVRRTKRNNRIMREELLKQNHCIIGCKNCNAQQCPNNPNYINKLL